MAETGDGPEGALEHQLMRVQMRLLAELAAEIGGPRSDLRAGLRRLTEVSCKLLHVARAGVWRFDDAQKSLECLDLYDAATGAHSDGAQMRASDLPAYFDALEGARAIVSDDTYSDPRLLEIVDDYLRPLGITSMIDAPIRVRGRMVGVVCHEHCGPRRLWSALEQTLTGTFADFAGIALESHEFQLERARSRRLEDQLERARKLESLGILAGGVAHDFNNLLVGILGNAGLCLQDLPKDSPLVPLLEDIQGAANQAAELAQEMLAYSGKATFKSEPLRLDELVRELIPALERRLGPRITLVVRDPPSPSPALPVVDGDPAQLRRVVINLVQNAAEAHTGATGEIELELRAHAALPEDPSRLILGERLTPGPHLALCVRDRGHGISEDARARLFDPFFTTKVDGRGLGLAVVLGIVAGHRGAIQVDSEPGRGSALTVYLPLTDAAPRPRPPPPLPLERRPAAGLVLVADDEAIVRGVTRRILDRAGYRVLEAEDGVDAVAVFHARRGELTAVILDLTMPRLGGQEVLSQIREHDPQLRVLLTSGFSREALDARLIDAPRTAFLQKPFNPSALLSALDALRAQR
jgi:signal transduction histidine kinase/CheY-like chemotaxis protein